MKVSELSYVNVIWARPLLVQPNHMEFISQSVHGKTTLFTPGYGNALIDFLNLCE